MTREQLRKAARSRIADSGKSMRAFAEDIGLSSAAHLCRFLKHGSRPPANVITALGYRAVDKESYELRK